MTYEEYINNPLGKNNAVFSGRELFRAKYIDALDKLYVRENGNIQYLLFNDNKETYYIYIKIPSETITNFYYDVVVKFSPKDAKSSISRELTGYNVKFFSNDPSFVFTYAHSFLKNDLFISELSPKMDKIALKEKAKVRNPYDQVGYVKSLYFTYLIMKNKGLFHKIRYEGTPNFDAKMMMSKYIMDADEKISQRQEAAKTITKSKSSKNANSKEEKRDQDKNNERSDNTFNSKYSILKSKRSAKSTKSNVIKPSRKSRLFEK